MPKENELIPVTSVSDVDKIRVVTSGGLSHSIEVGHLKGSLSIDDLFDDISALETRANINDTAHGTMDSRLASLETAVGDEGDGETVLPSGLVKKVSDMKSKLDQVDPSEINLHSTQLSEVRGRLDIIDGTNGRLDVLEEDVVNLNNKQTTLEEDVTDLANTKLDQSTFQSAVAAGFKIIGKTPASAIATGEPGEVCWDTEYFYVCVGTNTWKRIPLDW